MSSPGFIYILTNPSLTGIVKIGKTTRTPVDRVAELSAATGVPTPFQLVYFAEFEDCDAAERSLHALFTERNARVANNREFFRIDPHEAITAMIQMHTEITKSMLKVDTTDSSPEPTSLVNLLIADAKAYLTGMGGRYQDIPKAISIFQNAVDLASAEACLYLGMIYRNYEEAFDLQKAKIILQKGAEFGSIECNAVLASTFIDLSEKSNAEKAWVRYFSDAYQLSSFDRGHRALQCVEHIAMGGLSHELTEFVKHYKEDMAYYVEEADLQGISEPVGTTRKTLLDLAQYTLFGTIPSNLLTGRIKWFNSDKGFGFITGNDGHDYFLHLSKLLCDTHYPKEGQAVRFQSIPGELGLSAVNVLGP